MTDIQFCFVSGEGSDRYEWREHKRWMFSSTSLKWIETPVISTKYTAMPFIPFCLYSATNRKEVDSNKVCPCQFWCQNICATKHDDCQTWQGSQITFS